MTRRKTSVRSEGLSPSLALPWSLVQTGSIKKAHSKQNSGIGFFQNKPRIFQKRPQKLDGLLQDWDGLVQSRTSDVAGASCY